MNEKITYFSICPNCEEVFVLSQSQLTKDCQKGSKNLYCSAKCRYNSRRKKGIKLYCKFCGNEILRDKKIGWPSYYKRKFCDYRCHGKYRSKKGLIYLYCENCNRKMQRTISSVERCQNIFCCKKCYSEYMRKKPPEIIYIGICDYCGEGFHIKAMRLKRYENLNHMFCSLKCSNKFNEKTILKMGKKNRFKKKHEPWNKGLSKKTSEKMKKIAEIRTGSKRPDVSEYMKNQYYWGNDEYLFNIFKGQMFGKDYKPNELDKEIIRTRVRLFKIQQKEINHERQIDGN